MLKLSLCHGRSYFSKGDKSKKYIQSNMIHKYNKVIWFIYLWVCVIVTVSIMGLSWAFNELKLSRMNPILSIDIIHIIVTQSLLSLIRPLTCHHVTCNYVIFLKILDSHIFLFSSFMSNSKFLSRNPRHLYFGINSSFNHSPNAALKWLTYNQTSLPSPICTECSLCLGSTPSLCNSKSYTASILWNQSSTQSFR